ncbi:DUF4395 family protein [Fusobacterium sp. PH5-44]|uniref:DUF4395 family protein n=1 Tax=unclassified Fusobacterium TaxID=2648384 RepID=UPI003D1EFA1D
MCSFKPVAVSKGGFTFCRYTICILVWASLFFKNKWILIIVFGLMILSYILKIQKSPLVFLYANTIDKIKNSGTDILDEKGMRFAHAIGAIMSGLGIIIWTFASWKITFIYLVFLATMKTSAAIGRCSALKLYTCIHNDNCCNLGKFLRRNVND